LVFLFCSVAVGQNGVTTGSTSVRFCTPIIDIGIGDKFNIRDFIVDTTDPAVPIDWSNVMFSGDPFHSAELLAGKSLIITPSDVKFDGYNIIVKGISSQESYCKIRVWNHNSLLGQMLADPMCGIARGSVLSSDGKQVKFCLSSITLTTGDVINIRDIVVNEISPTNKIYWTNIFFYFSDNVTWHVSDFATGTPFMILDSDFGKGNKGPNQFRLSLTDIYGSDSSFYIKLTMNTSTSEAVSLLSNLNCGYARDELPINQIDHPYPAITTVAFDYQGQTVPNIGSYVADLIGLPPQWVKSCPQKSSGFECVQFVDVTLNYTNIDTTLWADRLLQYINAPQKNDSRGDEWTRFSRAKISGFSSLNNNQPLVFDARGSASFTEKKSILSNGLLVIALVVIATIVTVVGFCFWKLKAAPPRI